MNQCVRRCCRLLFRDHESADSLPLGLRGFTLLEVMAVIVVIAILAIISTIAYFGITQHAVVASLQSDLDNAVDQIEQYQMDHGNYPSGLDGDGCPTGPADTKYCLKASSGNSFTQYTVNDSTFGLSAQNGTTIYRATNTNEPVPCASGFVVVPGNTTLGTSAFCAMKYEAKNDGSNNAVSVAAGTPWASITQVSATTKSAGACSGCHLMTEAERLTITHDVIGVTSNWSGGVVGSSYIYSGHNDGAPNETLAADTNDNNGYVNTGNFAGDSSVTNDMVGNTQRRTLTLSNGEVIWDFVGNIWEWTNATLGGGQQPGLAGEAAPSTWKECNDPNLLWNGLSAAAPANIYSGAGSWSSSNGIGKIYSNSGELDTHGILRGGKWDDHERAGVFALNLNNAPDVVSAGFGFRVAR